MEVSFSVGRGSGAFPKNKIWRGLDNGGGGAYAIYMNNRSNERMLENAGEENRPGVRVHVCAPGDCGARQREETLFDLAELFKIFGDSTRIKILYVLFESEMCVCDIAQLLGMSQSAISHQLQVLKKSKLVKYRRKGKTVFYSLADSHVRTILGQGMEHVTE